MFASREQIIPSSDNREARPHHALEGEAGSALRFVRQLSGDGAYRFAARETAARERQAPARVHPNTPRNSRFMILPLALRGSHSRCYWILTGALNAARRASTKARS